MDPTFENARKVAVECRLFADELARQGVKRALASRTIRGTLGLIGIAAIVATYVPVVTSLIGENAEQKISLVAALALILSALGPLLVSPDPPERFHDFAHYIRSYDAKIQQAFANHQLTGDQKRDTLFELSNIARANLDDVKNKWPSIAQRVRAAQRTRALEDGEPVR